ncbi:putative monooxygenase [Aspergillus bombycis]|uniref:Putative monooxygenase n=1 Tax=Aspergillus bombycis TaxID=109264 RepID=A0A1F7ZT44_9EURO|nr:putative monooxygenase [Aspergillus bombycis]OGM42624.1 putative monooxygenase [Aspergillus bombycis]
MAPFRVLIAGGSITGLSLALMLEKNNIDFLVLEAYPDIAPQVGASLGLQPNGLRILDQLGCCDELLEHAKGHTVQDSIYRMPNGDSMWQTSKLSDRMIERHGYPVAFMDRQKVLQTLYSKVQDKSKILTEKKVRAIDSSDLTGVKVITTDGSVYSGDIVVGADGIHSTVRQEMARLNVDTGRDYLEEKSFSATYSCVFGISHRTPGIEPCTLQDVFNDKFSYLIADGPGDRTYFFLFEHMDRVRFGREIPRLTEANRDEIVGRHLDDPITPEVRFGDIYARRIRSGITPLQEYVYKHWHFGRMIALGDASHKFHPLTGQGANCCLETAACFTNGLVKLLLSTPPEARVSDRDISIMFETVQQTRRPRVSWLIEAAHRRQKLEAMDTPELKSYVATKIPSLPIKVIYNEWLKTFPPAVSLHMLPPSRRPHEVLYHDELGAQDPKESRDGSKL